MGLQTYHAKRKFGATPEPRGRQARRKGHAFVIQKHAASRLHYDLRLEHDGVMKSWAVTRGPSLVPGEKRLAVRVEDHPIEYNSFEGIIPQGQYGGGTVMIWDRGTWQPEGDPARGLEKGQLDFTLDGKKLRGAWHLVRMRGRPGEKRENWLLIKGRDEAARDARDPDILEDEPDSVVSGRSIDEIASNKRRRVWQSNRKERKQTTVAPAPRAALKAAVARNGRGAPARARRRAAAKAAGRSAGKKAAKRKADDVECPDSKVRKHSQWALSELRNRKGHSKRYDSSAAFEPEVRNRARRDMMRTSGSRHVGGAPLPAFVPPSLATLREQPPSGANWLHEVKFDGYRIQARLDRGEVRLLTRKGLDWTGKFPNVARAVATLRAGTALIDGEIVIEDEHGISSFSGLQAALSAGERGRFVYYVFDLLHLDGDDLSQQPLTERKRALEDLLGHAEAKGPIRYSEHFATDGARVLSRACDLHLEGIVSKRGDAPYRPGRSENFIKTKCANAQEFVVGGFVPSTALPRAIGSLVVGYYDHGMLVYAGRMGTGYTRKIARDLYERLHPLEIDKPPYDRMPATERRRDTHWVEPRMVIESEFRGWTGDGLVRQAAFKGVREDKPAAEVVREVAAMPNRKSSAAAKKTSKKPAKAAAQAARTAAKRSQGAPRKPAPAKPWSDTDVRFTHPDRIYWVDVGITKEDLADYYRDVWDWMAPQVTGRPLALVRCPDGTKGQCFFQKHASAGLSEQNLHTVIDSNKRQIIAVESLSGLLSLVQAGVLEVHVRGSKIDSLDICDRIVFDLDPGEDVGWSDIVAAAQDVRDRLAAVDLESFVKLSGGKGLHVVVPTAGHDWDTTKTFVQAFAQAMAADAPERYVAKMTKSIRKGKVFVDYLRNSLEQTAVAAYSTRARAGAPVSVPVTWQELGRTTGGNQYSVMTLMKRLRGQRQDPWQDLPKLRQKLPTLAALRRRG